MAALTAQKKTEKEWPEPGDPPLNYDKVIPVPDDEDYFLYPLVPWNLGGVTYTPAREGYTFTGWYLEPELKTKVTFLWLEKDVAVYAGWEPDGSGTSDDSDRKYALHFVTNGGTSYIDKGYDPGTTVTLD